MVIKKWVTNAWVKQDIDITIAEIVASGTPGSTTYLRGDGVWATPPDANTWRGIDTTPVSGQGAESISSSWAYTHQNSQGEGAHMPDNTTSKDVLKGDGDYGSVTVDMVRPNYTIYTGSTHQHSYNYQPNETLIINSTTNLYVYLSNMNEGSNGWQTGDTFTIIKYGTGTVAIADSCGVVYRNIDGTAGVGTSYINGKYKAVTCVIVNTSTTATNWVVIGDLSATGVA